MHRLRVLSFISAAVLTGIAANAQERATSFLPGVASSSSATSAAAGNTCSALDLQTAQDLSLKQRICWYGSPLFSKSFPVRGAVYSGMAEWRRSDVRQPSFEDFGRRFGVYYARKTAENTGQLLVGYLHHEDPRFRPSLEHGVWKRSRSALLSVLATRDENGEYRPALAPIAGAFSSGMVGMAAYRMHNSLPDGIRRSGFVYGTYFSTALIREFRPELFGLASRFLHRN